MFERQVFLIGGESVKPHGSTSIEIVSPTTEEIVGRVPLGSEIDIDAAVKAARIAFDMGPWPRMSVAERRKVLLDVANLLDEDAPELDSLATAENGVPVRNRQGYLADGLRYLANLTPQEPEYRVGANGEQAAIVHEPAGVVAAIVPWNAPLPLSMAKVGPALLAGCTVVLKPAPETPLTAYPFVEAFLRAGLPPGALNLVPADRRESELLVRHPGVDHVSFTGSKATGKIVGAICGEQVKRFTLELGGKSAAIVLDDADLATVAPAVLGGGMLLNNGEACCAWTRILVPANRHDEVLDALCDVAKQVRIGDPSDAECELGPLISSKHRDKVEGYIKLGREEGAVVAIGGGRPPALPKGWYVEPTILARANNDMRSSREEIFGPVVSVIPYANEEEAIKIANDSDYGLSAAVFTAQQQRGLELAARIRSGMVGVNSLAYNIAFPFGGFKQSGIGRQYGREGLNEFYEIKAIQVSASATSPLS